MIPATIARFAPTAVCDLAQELIREGRLARPVAACPSTRVEIDEVVLRAAADVLLQINLVMRSTSSRQAGARAVGEALNIAETHYDACAGAVGVTAVLADLLRQPNEAELAQTLNRARAAFTDAELLHGAAALTAGFSVVLADLLDLDAVEVQLEVQRTHRSPATRRTRRSVCRVRAHTDQAD